jgi:hypothetical protein
MNCAAAWLAVLQDNQPAIAGEDADPPSGGVFRQPDVTVLGIVLVVIQLRQQFAKRLVRYFVVTRRRSVPPQKREPHAMLQDVLFSAAPLAWPQEP